MISEVDKFLYTNTAYKKMSIALDFSRPRIRRPRMLQIQIRRVESSTDKIMDNYSMKWAVDRMVGTFVQTSSAQDSEPAAAAARKRAFASIPDGSVVR